MTIEEQLPAGWDLARVRAMWPGAELLPPDAHPVYWSKGPHQRDELKAQLILNFGGMCLVRALGDPAWWMGQLNQSDGSIVCWSQYGTDLERAIQAL
jgi:hypothetical protein